MARDQDLPVEAAVAPTTDIRTRPVPNCSLCGARGTWVYRGLEDRLLGFPGKWNLKKCDDPQCGLHWLDPMPEFSDLLRLRSASLAMPGDAPERSSIFWKAQGFVHHKLNRLLGRITGFNSLREQHWKMYLGDLTPGRVLDVGCGYGRMLARLKDRGWDVEGTECDVHAAEEARRQLGCVVHNGEPTQLSLSERSFDAVTLQHVIEHHPDPIALVAECRRVLAPQGHLVIMTPNARGWGHRRYGDAWRGLEPPRHLLIHTRQSIDHVVREAGFKSYWSMTTPAGAEYFIAASRQIRRRMAGRKSSLRHGMLFSVSWLLQYEEFLAFSADAEVGDEIVCIAQK